MQMRAKPKATAAPGKTLLDASDHVLIMIDHQPQMAFATASIDGTRLRNNIALVANAAKAFAVPAILTTLSAESFAGSMLSEVCSAWPSARVFDRTNMNCWEDPQVIAEVNRHRRSRIVLSGLWTGVCVCSAALSALDQDFDVYVITDACGDLSEDAHRLAIDRMLQIGARPLTALTYLLELQRDWTRTRSAAKVTNIILTHGGLHGIGLAYAAGTDSLGAAPEFFRRGERDDGHVI
jgi:nicotinamidase-related amidase